MNESDFQQKVVEASRQTAVVVDFWAGGARPVLHWRLRWSGLSKVRASVILAKVRWMTICALAGHYRLRGFPTVILFRGDRIGRFSGSRPAHWIREWLRSIWVVNSRNSCIPGIRFFRCMIEEISQPTSVSGCSVVSND